jgi:pimeloyl-ACP methyl ester carboxylesterase
MGPPTREELAMNVSLHIVDEGAGPAVVLLHGFPDSSALWRRQIPVLVEAGYRVIARRRRAAAR